MAMNNDGKGEVYAQTQPNPTPSVGPAATDSSGLKIPTQFGNTRTDQGVSLTMLLKDDPAMVEIAGPVVAYITNSSKGVESSGLFMQRLSRWYDIKNCTYAQAWADQQKYFRKWPQRNQVIDWVNITVEKVNWNGIPCYLVCVPIDWTVTNSKQTKTGHSVVAAWVNPGTHTGTGHPDYFISGVCNATPNS
jgi:hypothetical protein